jgi:hypothetical protein
MRREHEINQLKAKDEAAKKFFDSLGAKDHCKAGTKTLGSYGQMITIK